MPRTLGSDGFHTFTAHASTNRVYVSSSYAGGSNDGSYAHPYTTISAGYAAMRDGYPDWLMLKKGDTFNGIDGAALGLTLTKSGLSSDDLQLITCYDDEDPLEANPATSTPRPIFKTENTTTNYGVYIGNKDFIGVVGIEFYCAKRDPDSPEFGGSGSAASSMSCFSHYGATTATLLEDCKATFFTESITIQGIAAGPEYCSGVELRHLVMTHGYIYQDDRGSGLGMFYAQDPIIENCMFDHNGWNDDPSYPNTWGEMIFMHNYYIAAGWGTRINNCIIARDSGGSKFEGGGEVTNTLFLRNDLCTNVAQSNYVDSTFSGNVVLEATDMPVVGEGYGWGLSSYVSSGTGHPVIITDNIFAHWVTGNGFGVNLDNNIGCTVTDNIFYSVPTGWSGNGRPISYTGSGHTISNNDENLSAGTYSDPTRTIDDYAAEIGVGSTWQDYLAARANMFRGNYDSRLEAQAAINFIRAGFDLPPNGLIPIPPPFAGSLGLRMFV